MPARSRRPDARLTFQAIGTSHASDNLAGETYNEVRVLRCCDGVRPLPFLGVWLGFAEDAVQGRRIAESPQQLQER